MKEIARICLEIALAVLSTAISGVILTYIGAPVVVFVAFIALLTCLAGMVLMRHKVFQEFFWDLMDGKPVWKSVVKDVEGCYGREKIITDIYDFHMQGIENKCALLCGYGGTGKTTVAKSFEKVLKCKTNIIVCDEQKLQTLNEENILSNTIIFCDYVLESLERIIELYNKISCSKKRRVTLVLIERSKGDLLFRGHNIHFGKEFDLNASRYLLEHKVLKDIVLYNIKEKNEAIGNSISEEMLETLVNLLEERFDVKYKRPLFGVVLAGIYSDNPGAKFNDINSISELFGRYWETMTREKRIKNFVLSVCNDENFSVRDEKEITDISNRIRNQMKVLTAIASLLTLEFEYSGDKIRIYENNIEVSEKYKILKKVIQEFWSEESAIKSRLLNYYAFYDYTEGRSRRIEPLEYDLISNWLFVDAIKSNNEQFVREVFEAINKYPRLIHRAFAYAIRASDEMFTLLLIYLSEHIQYDEYNAMDYYKDIQLCLEEMFSVEKNNKLKFEACKNILEQLITNFGENRTGKDIEEVKSNLMELLAEYSESETSIVVNEIIMKLEVECPEKRKEK